MKTISKLFLTLLISTLLILSVPLHSEAFLDKIIGAGDKFLEDGQNSSSTSAQITEGDLVNLSNMVSDVLLAIATGVTVISGAVMAINFIVQSVEDKAKVKESMIPWFIGILVSFGAFGIWEIIVNIFFIK